MLAVMRFQIRDQELDAFLVKADSAVAALSRRPGFVHAQVGRALDDADLMVILVEFADVGSYRRALSNYDVKMRAVQLLSQAIDEPTAFEVLHQRTTQTALDFESSLAPDHDTFSVGD